MPNEHARKGPSLSPYCIISVARGAFPGELGQGLKGREMGRLLSESGPRSRSGWVGSYSVMRGDFY